MRMIPASASGSNARILLVPLRDACHREVKAAARRSHFRSDWRRGGIKATQNEPIYQLLRSRRPSPSTIASTKVVFERCDCRSEVTGRVPWKTSKRHS